MRARGGDAGAVERVLAALEAEDLLSEERFTGHYVDSRIGRGHGPLRIGEELRRRGIDGPVAQAALDRAPGVLDRAGVVRARQTLRRGGARGVRGMASSGPASSNGADSRRSRYDRHSGRLLDSASGAATSNPPEDVQAAIGMKSNELRRTFLDYFRERGHEVVPSSPLVPGDDPTLLFTNSGMVQFKDVFLGTERRAYTRATTAQRCVRAGGKHNDLENVGYTARHHTFFEMLGNFSFGDYFKRDAIRYCWELLTGVLGLPPEKLWVTVYESDDEAARIWFDDVGVDPARLHPLRREGQLLGDGRHRPLRPLLGGVLRPRARGARRAAGEPRRRRRPLRRAVETSCSCSSTATLPVRWEPLPRPSVDTGMGLERAAAVLQGVHSNYETDLFRTLIDAAAEITGAGDPEDKSLRVVADHVRSCAFLVTDGVVPSNEGRGYVLRRIVRRAIRHGHRLGMRDPFFWRMVAALDAEMGDAYPELRRRRERVERVLRQEEEQFARTLDQGMRVLEDAIDGLEGGVIPGETVFRLYDTYGFPVDLTADVARERSLGVDLEEFERAMEGQPGAGAGVEPVQGGRRGGDRRGRPRPRSPATTASTARRR